MKSCSRNRPLPGVLVFALFSAVLAGCGNRSQPPVSVEQATSNVRLTLQIQRDGVYMLAVPALDPVRADRDVEEHYARIAEKLTPAAVGTDRIEEITLDRQRITVRTHVNNAADCDEQTRRIKQALADLYPDVRFVSASVLEPTQSDLDDLTQVLEARADALGLTDMAVRTHPPDTLAADFACVGDPERAKSLLTTTGLLQFRSVPRKYAHEDRAPEVIPSEGKTVFTFRDQTGTEKPTRSVIAQSEVIVSGRQFAPTSRVVSGEGRPTGVSFSLREEAVPGFRQFTADHTGTYMAIVLDGRLISCPLIRSPIAGGSGIILADFDQPGGMAWAEDLTILINSGPLPLDLECVESTAEQLPP